jgi:hypothetical protein
MPLPDGLHVCGLPSRRSRAPARRTAGGETRGCHTDAAIPAPEYSRPFLYKQLINKELCVMMWTHGVFDCTAWVRERPASVSERTDVNGPSTWRTWHAMVSEVRGADAKGVWRLGRGVPAHPVCGGHDLRAPPGEGISPHHTSGSRDACVPRTQERLHDSTLPPPGHVARAPCWGEPQGVLDSRDPGLSTRPSALSLLARRSQG